KSGAIDHNFIFEIPFCSLHYNPFLDFTLFIVTNHFYKCNNNQGRFKYMSSKERTSKKIVRFDCFLQFIIQETVWFIMRIWHESKKKLYLSRQLLNQMTM